MTTVRRDVDVAAWLLLALVALLLGLFFGAVAAAQTTTTRTDVLLASTRAAIGTTTAGAGPLRVVGLGSSATGALLVVDASGDIGTAGTVNTSTTFSSTFVANGTAQLNGTSITLGNATSDTLTIGARLGSGLTWATDATYDIGASGANRPNHLYLAGNAVLGGSLQAATGIVARTATATDGFVAMYQGSSANIGYVAWHEPTTGTRQGYLGWGSSNINMTFEDNAHFRVNGMLWADEMHVKSFTADLEQALAGGQIIAKSVAVVAQDFACPAAGGTTTLYVRDLPSMANTAAFQTNDWVVLRTFSRTSGSLSVAECVGQVSSYADQSGATEGQQSWTFTRGTSACAGGWTTGAITADSLAIDYGASGNGYHQIDAASGAYNVNGPFAQIVTWTTCPIAANRVTQAKWGQLNGTYGYSSSTFGFAAGTYTGNAITVDPTNGIRMLNNGAVLGQWSGSTLTLGQPLTANNTGQLVFDSDSVDMNWRNNSGVTSSVFRVSNSGGVGIVTINDLRVVGRTLQADSDGTLTIATSGLTNPIVLTPGAAGAVRPSSDVSFTLGDASYRWNGVYTNGLTVGSAATKLTFNGGAWYFDGTYKNTLNCSDTADSDQACWINYRGYNGGTTRARDLYLGDGKGGTMLQVDGVNARVGINKSAPSYTLDVNGTANATSYRVGGTAGVSGTCASVTVTNGIVTTCTP